jgi:hypothetical protein
MLEKENGAETSLQSVQNTHAVSMYPHLYLTASELQIGISPSCTHFARMNAHNIHLFNHIAPCRQYSEPPGTPR